MQSVNLPSVHPVRIYDANLYQLTPDVIGPTVINCYSALTVPAWFRAMNFLATNLASFSRSVVKDGAKRTAQEDPHPLDVLLKRRPNGYQNPFLFWSTWFLHASHNGNGFARIDRDAGFRPLSLHNMLPEEVTPFRYDRGDGGGPRQYYLHSPAQGEKKILNGADVLHLAGLSWDGIAGLDPIQLHARTIERAATLDKYLTRFLRKGSVVRGAVEIPGGMTDEQLAQFKKIWRETFNGANGEGDDVAILTEGAKLNNASLSPHDAQLVQQAAYGTKQISQVTGVPPEVLFELSEAKYNTSVEQAGQNVVRYCFRPIIEQAEAELSTKLLSEIDQQAGYAVQINADALLRGDTKAVSDEAEKTVKSALRTRNEGRALLGLAPDPDPESDKLKALGDSTPAAGGESGEGTTATPGESGSAGGPTASRTLNGYHVAAACDLAEKLKEGTVDATYATELLVGMGLARDRAEAMVSAAAPKKLEATTATAATSPAATFTDGPHKFSSTQFDLPDDAAAKVLAIAATIPDSELAEDGRETVPHVTVLYGLHDEDPAAVVELMKNTQPVTFRLGRVSVFYATPERQSDVVKFDVEGDDLHALNSRLAKLPHTQTHPGYHPHVTLAYVQPGAGQKYEGRTDLQGTLITVDRLVFSSRDGSRTEIPLTGGVAG